MFAILAAAALAHGVWFDRQGGTHPFVVTLSSGSFSYALRDAGGHHRACGSSIDACIGVARAGEMLVVSSPSKYWLKRGTYWVPPHN